MLLSDLEVDSLIGLRTRVRSILLRLGPWEDVEIDDAVLEHFDHCDLESCGYERSAGMVAKAKRGVDAG